MYMHVTFNTVLSFDNVTDIIRTAKKYIICTFVSRTMHSFCYYIHSLPCGIACAVQILVYIA